MKFNRYKHNINSYKYLTFKFQKKNIKIDFKKIKKKYKLSSVIKFLPIDFKNLENKFYHFNIHNSNHKKKKNYLILKIYKKGFFDGDRERLPIYSSKKIYIYQCFFLKEKILIKDVKRKFFKKSLKNTNTPLKLLKCLKRRYIYLFKNIEIMPNTQASITGLKFRRELNFMDLR